MTAALPMPTVEPRAQSWRFMLLADGVLIDMGQAANARSRQRFGTP